MKTKVGAKLSSASCLPANPATRVSAQRNTPIAPHATWTAGPAMMRPIPPGSGRQSTWPSMTGRGQSTASATNETTSTAAAAQPNSHSGIGRFARWISPCADAWAGHSAAAATTTTPTALAADREERPVRVRTAVHAAEDEGRAAEAVAAVVARAVLGAQERLRVADRRRARQLVGLDVVALAGDPDAPAVLGRHDRTRRRGP